MDIKKCDICKKTIKPDTGVGLCLGNSILNMHEICAPCSQPIMKFLKAKKLIKGEKSKKS